MLASSLALLPAVLAAALSWTPTTPLPDGYDGHALLASGNYLYNVGGLSSTNGVFDAQNVFVAPIQPSGNIGAWTAASPLPVPVFYHAGTAANGYLYVLGGYHYDGSLDMSSAVFYAKQNADGSLGAWSATASLPQQLFFLSATVWNGQIYVAGGWNGTDVSSAVYSARLNPDGSLAPWQSQRSLPEGVYTHAEVSDGTLYVLGGAVNGGSQISNSVWAAPINADGTLGPWSSTTPLPQPLSNHGAIVAGRVYVLGGWNGSTPVADVVSAPSSPSGLGAWTAEAPMPQGLYLQGVTMAGGRVYVSGGAGVQATQNTVYWSPLPAPPPPSDTTPPVTSLAVGSPDVDGFVSPATPFSLSAADAGSGVAATYWSVDGGTFAPYAGPFTLPAGEHWVGYYSVDKAGNTESVKTASAAVDGAAPVSALAAGAPQAVLASGQLVVSSSTLLSVQAEDPSVGGVASGVAGVTASVDGKAVAASAPFGLPASDGAHQVSLQAVDAVGNAEAAHVETVYVDQTAPATTLTPTTTPYVAADAGAPWLGGAAQLVFSAQDPAMGGIASGVHETDCELDGAAPTPATASLVLAEGAHTVAFRSVDNVGNAEAWKSVSYRVDATAPQTTLSVGSPVFDLFGQELATADTPLSLSAQDSGSGVARTLYALDGGPDQAYAAVFHLAAGAHSVSFYSVDNTGNVEPRQSVSVQIGTLLADAVAASQSVTLSGRSSVNGDVRAPQVTLDGRSTVSGTIYRSAPAESADLSAALAYAQAHNAGPGGDLILSGRQAMTLAAGTYVFSSLQISGQASLSVSGAAQVFVAGPIQVSGQGALNASGSADDLWIFSNGARVSVTGSGRAAFHLYAPLAEVAFSGGGSVAGRVYGKTVSLTGHSVLPSATTLPAVAHKRDFDRKAWRPRPEPEEPGGDGPAASSQRLDHEPPQAPVLGSAVPAAAPAAVAAWPDRPGRRLAASKPFSLPVAAQAAFGLVTADGATVRTSSGPAITVPAGAVSGGLAVTVNVMAKADPIADRERDEARAKAGLTAVGDPIQFGPEGTHFAKPVTIELPFDPSKLPAGAALDSLVVEYWNPQAQDWEAMPSVVDPANRVVRGQTTHFSLYQVHAAAAGPNSAPVAAAGPAFGQVYAYPNPARGVRPVIHAEVTGADSIDVDLYDMAGQRLQSGSAVVANGVADYAVDTGGLGSGVYLYVVKAGSGSGIRYKGRLAVIK